MRHRGGLKYARRIEAPKFRSGNARALVLRVRTRTSILLSGRIESSEGDSIPSEDSMGTLAYSYSYLRDPRFPVLHVTSAITTLSGAKFYCAPVCDVDVNSARG